MLKIRLQRTGRKHEPTFRIVLTDSKNSTKSGKFKEVLGSYDPRKADANTIINKERVSHWLSHGAEASGTVHNLLISQKIIEGKKVNVLPKKTVAKKEEAPVAEAAPAPATEAPPAPEATPAPEVEPTPTPESAPEPAPAEETPSQG